ncbi:Fic family protein [Luteolibacter pohnpeiensis]|uniref:Fic family protein n=1 Tax=Luteolibacter pohnpeiensis TaxID=454153 RepID=A0A934SAB7_9BACT|nr:Fic family protein [Luteolibacter pohnpeiensis]MBK1884189.1 Fic family protein [Luteolibacter pohnpeiensis]
MKFPKIPPDWQKLLKEVANLNKVDVFIRSGQEESARTDRYLHWDEFSHRASPGELSLEQQWAAIRMRRNLRSQSIPLTDSKGRPFTFFLTQRAFEILHEIDLNCGGRIGVHEDGILQENTRDRYYVDSIVEEALTSSQLEGAVVTRSEAREMIRSHRAPATSHERMVINNYHTMRLISGLKGKPLTPELILLIHQNVTANTLERKEDEGSFRPAGSNVRVEDDESGEVFHIPPPAEELEERIERMCAFANETGMNGFLHPVIRSIILHFWVAFDHPFIDGNGRTARALFYWSMLRHGFWLAEFFSISHEILKAPKKYYRAFLHTETDANDLNYFILHQLEVILSSIKSLQSYIRRKQEEVENLRKHLSAGGDFNHRQLALLRHALKHPFASYTVVSHQTSHAISNQTAKNDLVALEIKNLLTKRKSGKAFVYSPASDLAAKLTG